MWFTPLLSGEAQPSGSTVAHSSGHYRTGGRGLVVQWPQAEPAVTPATARPGRGWDVRALRDSRVQLPQRRAATSGGVSIAPGVGALTITGYAPSIAQPHAVAAGVGSLTITGHAPTVEQVSGVQPGVGTLTLSGYAPTVTQSEAQAVFPGAGTLAFVGYAPTISQDAAPGNIFPPAGTVTITGHAPTVAQTGAGGGYSDSTPGRKPRKKTVVLHKDDADERKAEFSALLEKVRAQGAERAEAALLDDARRDNSPPLDPLNVRPPRMPEVRGVAPSALREWMPSLLAAYQSEYRATYADRFGALLREQQAAQARQSLIDDDEDVALLAMML